MRNFIILFFSVTVIFFSCKSSRPVVFTPKPQPAVVKSPEKSVEPKPKDVPKKPKEIKIALLLPLYLEQNLELDTNDARVEIEPHSIPALSFYEGALLAADSLEKTGIKVRLSVFDVAPDSSVKHSIMMKYQELKNFDLVFANFPSAQASAAAEVSKQSGMKMILTQSGNSSVLKNNPNLVFASPSTLTQCTLMADYIVNEFPYSNFIVLFRNIKRENELANGFKNATDSLLLNRHNIPNKTILMNYADSGLTVLEKYLSPEKRNILYFPSSDESYVSSVLSHLDTLNQKLTVVGLPTWENFESIPFNALINIEMYIFSSSFLDYGDSKITAFRKKFINHYKTDPLFNAYQGFDLIWHYSKLFNTYYMNFMEYLTIDSAGSPFKFVQDDRTNGFENVSISVLKFENNQLLKVNK